MWRRGPGAATPLRRHAGAPVRKASDLKQMAFPQCSAECSTVRELGLGECESVCPFKFRKAPEGRPWVYEHLNQAELDAHHRDVK